MWFPQLTFLGNFCEPLCAYTAVEYRWMLETEARRALFHLERCLALCTPTEIDRSPLLNAQESVKTFLLSTREIGSRDSFDNFAFLSTTGEGSFDLVWKNFYNALTPNSGETLTKFKTDLVGQITTPMIS
jgi:hypothetical protein